MSFWAESNWLALPKKEQLSIIFTARFCEALATSSTAAFLYQQLQNLLERDGSTAGDAAVASQLALYFAALNAPQSFTSILWGRLADSPYVGRKNVLLIGLISKGIASIGLAFASSFQEVLLWSFLAGATSNNLATMRTMIREMVADEYQSRALLLLPLAFNLGLTVGPPIAALILHFDPFSPTWPYAAPHIFNALCLLTVAVLVWLRLIDTMWTVRQSLCGCFPTSIPWRDKSATYKLLPHNSSGHEPESNDMPLGPIDPPLRKSLTKHWTSHLSLVLVARALMAIHIGAYQSLLTSFLFASRANTAFAGGLAFRTGDVAMALAIRGFAGLFLQLVFFPYLKARLGLLKLYQTAIIIFPVSYFVTPFLAAVPAQGPLLWAVLSLVLIMQTIGRSFALPASVMLLNEACPHKSVLGTVNGIGQSISAGARTFGPALFGWLFGIGLTSGVVGLAWWALAVTAVLGSLASLYI